jgi:DnaK suppressor protein
MGLTLMSEEGRKIALIQDAIQRLIDGSYGECVDCRSKISQGRLDALPYAKLCIQCKTAREQNDNLPPGGQGDEFTE